MIIERKKYLDKLISKKDNGLVKVITGIRRCGKSFLLFNLYHSYLNSIGIADENIIELALDEAANARYRNPLELDAYIRNKVSDKSGKSYVFLDEIQFVKDIQNPYLDDKDARIGFIDVILGLMKLKNVDLYITGSNSHMLSSDILTEFRGRGDEIHVLPLSYKEFHDAFEGDKRFAWREYLTYGGMPYILYLKSHEEKSKYLKDLFENVYIKDVLERNRILNDRSILEDLLNIIASSIGSLTNPTKLANTFQSVKHVQVNANTISRYLDCFIDAFILSKACRYDIKGKKYIETPLKYYFSDAGLRNARLNFRQQEENHIMENIIYNELIARGFDVDVGVVQYNTKDKNEKKIRTQLEIDFVANKGNRRYYIQSALSVDDEGKRIQETNSLNRVEDSFKKIVVVKDGIIPWYDEKGIFYIGIEEFLLDEKAIDS
ncbi:MAG: ATP-binding protein [Spirochaetes bacterium]|uniref:ATP-binding protein n=1 Tax=Candidatus Ornithospirochaeta stercoripullorum TaxID=2840899 RepID=A0A9D9E002_9SPIO|nr:ATP-binding protein [Candidatus Ornithospirochaeta stercoripullorum]